MPIFDKQPSQAIGALAVTPSDPKIVWAGTGEAWAIRDSDMQGDGIYKSTDAGSYLEAYGAAGERPHRPHHRAPHRRQYGLRVRGGTSHRAAGGAGRVPHQRWRQDLEAHPLRRPEHRLLRPLAGSEGPQHMVAGTWDVAMHTYAMFSGGPGSGVYIVARWRRHLEEGGRPRHAEVARRQDRCRHRAEQFEACVCVDPDCRPGVGVALRRRRRELGRGELAARADRARRILHSPRGESD